MRRLPPRQPVSEDPAQPRREIQASEPMKLTPPTRDIRPNWKPSVELSAKVTIVPTIVTVIIT